LAACDLLIASRNLDKVREIGEVLAGLPVRLLSLGDLPKAPDLAETGETFEENARAKALAVARWSGRPALADDSGLEIDALGGEPGVLSNRYAGEGAGDADRIAKVLGLMERVPDAERTARFRCAAALAAPDGRIEVVEGAVEGAITRAPRGSGGFGYDPIFVPEGERRTMAELTADEKNRLSHRGRAFRALRPVIAEWLGCGS
jgi:XTP/dITP diphosphohydrolase